MTPILIDWIWEGIFVILLVYLSATGLRSLFSLIFREKLPLQFGIAAVCAIYTATTWFFYFNHATPLSTVIPWMGLIILGGFLNAKSTVDSWKPVVEILGLFIIFAAFYSVLVADRRLPVVITGNNDVWAYAKFSHLALNQPMGNNIVNYNLLKTGAASQSPTAFMFLAGLACCSGQQIVDILGLGLILILTISVYIVKTLCVKHWHMRASLAYLIAAAWVTSAFSFYLASNYFFAQWLGICLFLATILIALSNEGSVLIRTMTLGLLNYVMFMTYPPLFFPYMGILLFLMLMESTFAWKNSGIVFFNSGLASLILSIPVSLGIAFVLDSGHFKTMMSLMIQLSSANNGWPFRLLSPFALMSFPVKSIDSGVGIFKMAGYFTILALVSYLTYRAHRTKILSSARFAVSAVFIVGVMMYLCYYTFKGFSYQQWKLAGSVVLPLAFVPIAVVVSAFNGNGRISPIVKQGLLIVLIGLNVFFIHRFAIRTSNHLRMLASLRELTHYDQAPNVKTIHVNLGDDFEGMMIALQFINQKRLALESLSYFSENKIEDYSKLSHENILITNSCSVFNPLNVKMFGESFCMINEVPSLAEKFFIQFNKPLPFILRSTGVSGQESWGRWSDGHQVTLDIPVDMKWKGVELKIKGKPFIPQGIKNQHILFSVHGSKVKELAVAVESEIVIQLNRAMFDDGRVKLTIDLPDAVSLGKLGSADTRVVGFGFQTLEVMAINEGGTYEHE